MYILFPWFCHRYYDDFHTIDWVRDRNRDRLRHKRLNRDGQLSWRGCTMKLWDAGSGWLIVFLVGVSSGLLAGEHTIYMTPPNNIFCGCPSKCFGNPTIFFVVAPQNVLVTQQKFLWLPLKMFDSLEITRLFV